MPEIDSSTAQWQAGAGRRGGVVPSLRDAPALRPLGPAGCGGLRVRGRSHRAVFVIPERSAPHWGICPYLVAGRQKFRPPSLTQTHTSLQPFPRLSGRNGCHPSLAAATPKLSWRSASPHGASRPPAEGKRLRESPDEPVFSLISPELGGRTTPQPRVCPGTPIQGMAPRSPHLPRHQSLGNGPGGALGALLLRVPVW